MMTQYHTLALQVHTTIDSVERLQETFNKGETQVFINIFIFSLKPISSQTSSHFRTSTNQNPLSLAIKPHFSRKQIILQFLSNKNNYLKLFQYLTMLLLLQLFLLHRRLLLKCQKLLSQWQVITK